MPFFGQRGDGKGDASINFSPKRQPGATRTRATAYGGFKARVMDILVQDGWKFSTD